MHCLSSSGRRDPRELSTAEAEAVIDELQRMQVFYVNVGGGEPTVRPDFWHLLDYADRPRRRRQVLHQRRQAGPGPRRSSWPRTDYVDVQISLDGATAEVNDAVRGAGSFATATRALENLAEAGMKDFKVSVVVTRENAGQLDEFKALTDRYGAQLRITRLRPSGRGADVWDRLHPTPGPAARALRLAAGQRRRRAHRRLVLPPLGVRRGAARAEPVRRRAGGLPDRPGRRRLRLPVRHPRAVPRRQRPRRRAASSRCGSTSELFAELRSPQTGGACTKCAHFDACRGGCMAAKFFTGLPLDGPDPECVQGYGETALAARDAATASRRGATSTTRTPARSAASPRCWACPASPPDPHPHRPPGPATSHRSPASTCGRGRADPPSGQNGCGAGFRKRADQPISEA